MRFGRPVFAQSLDEGVYCGSVPDPPGSGNATGSTSEIKLPVFVTTSPRTPSRSHKTVPFVLTMRQCPSHEVGKPSAHYEPR